MVSTIKPIDNQWSEITADCTGFLRTWGEKKTNPQHKSGCQITVIYIHLTVKSRWVVSRRELIHWSDRHCAILADWEKKKKKKRRYREIDAMSGQSITDRIAAAQHSMTGSAISKAVCKATTHEVSGPKKKHLDCEYMFLAVCVCLSGSKCRHTGLLGWKCWTRDAHIPSLYLAGRTASVSPAERLLNDYRSWGWRIKIFTWILLYNCTNTHYNLYQYTQH